MVGYLSMSVFALLSGTGILLAQIAWNRQLLLVTGGSVDATAVVLTAFMLGLGFGGRYFGKKAELAKNPLLVLKIAAGGAAIFSFFPLLITPIVRAIYPFFYVLGLQFPARFVFALVMIFPATFFAGGIIPVLGRLVEGSGGVQRVSRLYGLNALGSALGGFLAGFFMLEFAGILITLIVGAALTLLSILLIKSPKNYTIKEKLLKPQQQNRACFFWVFTSQVECLPSRGR